MKKILFLLLLTVASYGQVSTGQETEFDYGIKNNSTQTITTPTYLTTTGNDGTQGKIPSAYIAKTAAVQDSLNKKLNLPTGFLLGLQLSINADPTKFNIAPGYYVVTDFTNLANPVVKIITYAGATGLIPAYLATANSTYVALDINGAVVSSASPFTNADRRTLAIIGNVVHSNNTTINVTNEIKAPIVASTNQVHDFMRAIGFLNEEGNIYSPNGANLQINKSAGKIFGMGINSADYLNPHQLSIPAQTALTFAYRLRTGTQYANTTSIDPNNWDNAGVLTSVPVGNRWTIQRINLFQSGLTRIQYGQTVYTSYNDAVTALPTQSFVTEQNIADNAVFRCYLIVQQGTTNLASAVAAGTALFVPVDKFGNVIGNGSVALTYANIIAALGYTPENVANKSDSYTVSSSTTYPSTKALVDGLGTKIDKIPNTRIVDAFIYGFSPSNTGQANSIAINNALSLGGKIIVSVPGIYEIDDTIVLPSNTTIEFVKGCTLKHVTPATGRFVNTFKNIGCIDSTPNDNISIIGNGLVIDFNGHDGIEGGVSIPFAYQNGRISFYKVTNFNISGIYVNDPQDTYGMYFLQTTNCAFGKINDIELKRYPKDGIDMIHSNNIHIKNYRSTTGDDAIFMGSGWLGYDKSIGDTYNITIENWISDSIFRGVPSRIITTSWDNWTNGRTYAGSSEDASELCVNAGRVYRKTTNGNQVATNAPTHSTGTVIGADGIGWLVVSDTVKYTNDVYNIRYINCQVVNSSGAAHWFYESPTLSQNTHTAILKDVYFDNCSFISDSDIKTADFSSFISASCNLDNIVVSNSQVSFKENVANLGYNTFITIKQNENNNKIIAGNIKVNNLSYNGQYKGKFIITIGDVLELDKIDISNSNVVTSPIEDAAIVQISNQNVLKTLNITNSKINNISSLLFFAGYNWSTPIERVVNVDNSDFTNCRKIFTHQYSYPIGMNIYYNALGCRFTDTNSWILENGTGDSSMVVLNFLGNNTNTPSKIMQYPSQYTKKIFDLESGLAIVKDEIINGVTTVAPSQNAVFDALALKASLSGANFTGQVEVLGASFSTNSNYRILSTGTGLVAPNNGNINFVTNHPASPGWSANTNIKATFYKTTVYTVATLPTTGVESGTYATVSDATAPTYLGTLTGGGSVVCPVFYNGTAWVAH